MYMYYTYIYIYTHTSLFLSLSLYMYLYVCLYICNNDYGVEIIAIPEYIYGIILV